MDFNFSLYKIGQQKPTYIIYKANFDLNYFSNLELST